MTNQNTLSFEEYEEYKRIQQHNGTYRKSRRTTGGVMTLIRGPKGVTIDLLQEVGSTSCVMNGCGPDLTMMHTPDGNFYVSSGWGLIMRTERTIQEIGRDPGVLKGSEWWHVDFPPHEVTFGESYMSLKGRRGLYDVVPKQIVVFDGGGYGDAEIGFDLHGIVLDRMDQYSAYRNEKAKATGAVVLGPR